MGSNCSSSLLQCGSSQGSSHSGGSNSNTAATPAAEAHKGAMQTPRAIAVCHMFLCLRHGRPSVAKSCFIWTTALDSQPAEHGLQQYIASCILSHSALGMTTGVPSEKGRGQLICTAAVVAPHASYDSYTVQCPKKKTLMGVVLLLSDFTKNILGASPVARCEQMIFKLSQ